MLFRSSRSSARFTNLKVGVFFLAAGLWFGGLITESQSVRSTGLAVAGAGVVLALVEHLRNARDRRRPPEG